MLSPSPAHAGNIGVDETADPSNYTAVLAISDVHGMRSALDALLKGAGVTDADGRWAAKNTLLIVIGDSIDKGPQSLEVLDAWMTLAPQAADAGGRIVHLLGNHEAEFLATHTDPTDPAKRYRTFLTEMPLAARVGRWVFCHAGLYPGPTWHQFSLAAQKTLGAGRYGDPLLSADDSILEAKDWWQDPQARAALLSRLRADDMFGLVQGHQPKAYGFPYQIGSLNGGRLVKIDNGMAPQAGAHAGSILRFPKPPQMNYDELPIMQVLGPDGRVSPVPAN